MSTEIEVVRENELVKFLDVMGLAPKLNDAEKTQFLQISKAYNLNPFKREIYCTKYGDTMSIITGYEVYIKRAERSGQLDGWTATTTGSVQNGDLKATVTIYRKDRKYPFVWEALYVECVQKTREGKPTKFWEKADFMTKKVAISQAFRLCFSDELGGMPYTADEMPPTEPETVNTIAEVLPPISDERFQKAIDLIKQGDLSTIERLESKFSLNEQQQTILNECKA